MSSILWSSLVISLLSILGAVDSFGADSKTTNAKESIQQFFYEITDRDSSIFTLDPGVTTFSDAQLAELKTTVAAVRERHKLLDVVVVAYADEGYPAGSKESLAEPKRKLADERATHAKAKIKELTTTSVTTYNMAKKANWFEKTFATNGSQIKQETPVKTSRASDSDLFYESLGSFLQDKGGPGKVVVIYRHDQMQVAKK